MIAPTQLKKPSNWQDFEKLCKLLWGEVWNCSDTIKRNGRQGQSQNGVDVYVYVEKEQGYCGIQCKGKDDYTKPQLTEKEIDGEIEKAKNFRPSLKRFIFATTANKDAKTEEYIRTKNIESLNNGGFKIDIFSWEDIVDLLEQNRQTYNWYVNNCQFKDNTDVSVTFDGEEVTEIHPEYIKNITHYKLKVPKPSNLLLDEIMKQYDMSSIYKQYQKLYPQIKANPSYTNPFQTKYKHDYRWCSINIQIENIGSTVIRSPKLRLWFDPKEFIDIDDKFNYCNSFVLSDSAKAQINSQRERNRELFQTYSNVIEYRPKESVFVQNDYRVITISIKPRDEIKEVYIYWTFLCEDYNKEGKLKINVVPKYDIKKKEVTVEKLSDMKGDEMKIIPKIIEE